MHQSRTMKSATFSILLLILLGVAWCGDSHSWVGTEGKWVEGDPQDGEEERMDPLSSNGKGVQERKLRRIRHKGWM